MRLTRASGEDGALTGCELSPLWTHKGITSRSTKRSPVGEDLVFLLESEGLFPSFHSSKGGEEPGRFFLSREIIELDFFFSGKKVSLAVGTGRLIGKLSQLSRKEFVGRPEVRQ